VHQQHCVLGAYIEGPSFDCLHCAFSWWNWLLNLEAASIKQVCTLQQCFSQVNSGISLLHGSTAASSSPTSKQMIPTSLWNAREPLSPSLKRCSCFLCTQYVMRKARLLEAVTIVNKQVIASDPGSGKGGA
jgi:hypothetical protein